MTAPSLLPGLEQYRRRVCAVLAPYHDEAGAWERDRHLPVAVLRRLAEQGVFRDRWRLGAEGGLGHLVVLAEETTRVSSGLALAAVGHCEVFTGALARLAANDQQQALLGDAYAGRAVGCFAASEPHGGSDLMALRATARRRGDTWHLRGRKRYVSNIGGATHVLVVARLAQSAARGDPSLFVVPLSAPGVEIRGFFETTGLRSCDLGEVEFDAILPGHAQLGPPSLGLAYVTQLLQYERIAICVQLIAAGRLALCLAAAYARQRMVGGMRLIDKQAVRHRLGRCRADLWSAEAALRDLIRDVQAGQLVPHRIAALKLVTSATAGAVLDECLQVFGARGFTRNYPIERLWRDVRLARIGGGSDEVMTELVASHIDRPDPDTEALLKRYAAADVPRKR
jgi:alkylation response protein AidB-like acyl-CoA dehydrogenase